jgi:hypothetical protein
LYIAVPRELSHVLLFRISAWFSRLGRAAMAGAGLKLTRDEPRMAKTLKQIETVAEFLAIPAHFVSEFSCAWAWQLDVR